VLIAFPASRKIQMNSRLLIFPGVVIIMVDVSVEIWEPDEKPYADQVFNPLDVLVIVNQRENFLYMTNR
jgi:hypothetical protein